MLFLNLFDCFFTTRTKYILKNVESKLGQTLDTFDFHCIDKTTRHFSKYHLWCSTIIDRISISTLLHSEVLIFQHRSFPAVFCMKRFVLNCIFFSEVNMRTKSCCKRSRENVKMLRSLWPRGKSKHNRTWRTRWNFPSAKVQKLLIWNRYGLISWCLWRTEQRRNRRFSQREIFPRAPEIQAKHLDQQKRMERAVHALWILMILFLCFPHKPGQKYWSSQWIVRCTHHPVYCTLWVSSKPWTLSEIMTFMNWKLSDLHH